MALEQSDRPGVLRPQDRLDPLHRELANAPLDQQGERAGRGGLVPAPFATAQALIESLAGSVAAVETKATAGVTRSDTRRLELLRTKLGSRFKASIVDSGELVIAAAVTRSR